ncbi:hypothetical protein CHS0354_009822 [Potamilus streckersoni]|uniref:Uncharacterized protein n=1 Tax=Potamilus streckersoni TaxID=2493646 RepID=A0AAE0SWH3_9BIVA|nr:hypothetical protein CHS0354_009822 [Potamilus streckersoni]
MEPTGTDKRKNTFADIGSRIQQIQNQPLKRRHGQGQRPYTQQLKRAPQTPHMPSASSVESQPTIPPPSSTTITPPLPATIKTRKMVSARDYSREVIPAGL